MTTRTILAKKLKEPGLSFRDAAVYLDILIEALTKTLAKGESIQLRGFGTFQIVFSPEKKYPSSLSNNKIVPGHSRIIFRPCNELKQAVWNCKKGEKLSATKTS